MKATWTDRYWRMLHVDTCSQTPVTTTTGPQELVVVGPLLRAQVWLQALRVTKVSRLDRLLVTVPNGGMMGGQVHAWTRWEVQCTCHCARDTFTTLQCPEGPRNVNQSMYWRLAFGHCLASHTESPHCIRRRSGTGYHSSTNYLHLHLHLQASYASDSVSTGSRNRWPGDVPRRDVL